MKLHALRSVSALGLAVLLAACGAGPADQPTQTAAAMSVASQSGAAAMTVASPAGAVSQASSTMPAPDCATDGCKSPRIIDANAEAYRYDAMRRAAAEQAAGNTNT